MSSLIALILLTVLQLFCGMGLLTLFRIWLKPALFIAVSLLCGIGIFSIIPFLLQLLFIPLTLAAVFIALVVVSLLLNIKFKRLLAHRKQLWPTRFRISLYELPALLLIGFIVFVSVWRCFYYPPFPRDLTSGAEVIAEYTVKEKTMINSVFTINLESTNNQYKPPFLTSLQVIYKYAGFPFGQVWLSTLFLSFIVLLYHALSLKVHKLLAGILLVFFLAIPEMYAYSFMALFDYSNMVFFTLAFYFLFAYFRNRQRNHLGLAAFLMGLATYTRSETLVLAGLACPLLFWHHLKNFDGLLKIIMRTIIFLLPSIILYVLPVTIYINYYLPVPYSIEGLLNTDLLNILPLWQRFRLMNTELLFSETGLDYYGYFIYVFIFAVIFDLVFSDRWSRSSKNWICAVLLVYLGLPFLGYLFPLMDLDHSTKRALFKIFPFMLFYIGNSKLMQDLSAQITKWQNT